MEAHAEPFRDLLVGETRGQQLEHLELSRRERLVRAQRAGGRTQSVFGELLVDHDEPFENGVERARQPRIGRPARDDSAGSRGEGLPGARGILSESEDRIAQSERPQALRGSAVLDVDEDRLSDLDERIMLDGGRYVARSYRVDDFLAMWMIDVGLVQFYDGDGNMLRTVNLFEEIEPQRMAA